LAMKLKDAKKNTTTDCTECLACATNDNGNQVCCHISEGSPVAQGGGIYSCQKM
jgi:hypothetical protein